MKIKEIKSKSEAIQCNNIVKLNYNAEYNLISSEIKHLGLFNNENNIVAFIGYCLSPMDNEYVEIFSLNTHPEHVMNGYATKLLNKVYQKIKKIKNGDVRILLTCSVDLENFYLKRKFKKLNITKNKCLMYRETRSKSLNPLSMQK